MVKHLSAALFAVAMAGIFVLGIDGLLGAMHRLTGLIPVTPPADTMPPAAAPAAPGVVPAFIVPAKDDTGRPPAGSPRE